MREAGVIREAGMADLESMLELLGELFSQEADFAVNPKVQRRGLSLMLRPDPDRVVLVAEEHGEAVGMATAQLVISTAEGAPSALVEDVVVRPGRRGRGRRVLFLVEEGDDAGPARLVVLRRDLHEPGVDDARHFLDDGTEPGGVVLLVDVLEVLDLRFGRPRVADVVDVEAQRLGQVIKSVQLDRLSLYSPYQCARAPSYLMMAIEGPL